jgi:GTP-binding protein HflX
MAIYTAAKPRTHRAFLIGTYLPGESPDTAQDLLDELADLVGTMGATVAGRTLVKLGEPNPKFYIGSGKSEDLCKAAREAGADVIVHDHPLSPAQQRNWEALAGEGTAVIDREEVILDIFAGRASTREARLQVGLARLQYSLPRLTRAWSHLSRQGGGIGGRGEGETQLETDRRIVARKIDKLKSELQDVRLHRATQRKQRQRRPTPVAAIVGYTNAGKSSVLRALTQAEVLVEDKLFATLDPTTRKVILPNGQPLLLTDTVGFVRNLPHGLVEAFKATLEEAAQADFLIHVLDVNRPQLFDLYTTTREVLKEIGADDVPTLVVLNKCDLKPDAVQLAQIAQHFGDECVFTSTITGEGLDEVRHRLGQFLLPGLVRIEVSIPQARYDLVARLHSLGKVMGQTFRGEKVRAVATIPRRYLEDYTPFLVPSCARQLAAQS